MGLTVLRGFAPEVEDYKAALEAGWEAGTEEWVPEEGVRVGCQADDLEGKRGMEALTALQKCFKRADTKEKLVPPETHFLERFGDDVKAFMHNSRFAKAASLILGEPVRIFDNGVTRRDGDHDLLNMPRNMTMTRHNISIDKRHTVTISCPLQKSTSGGQFFFPGAHRPQSFLRAFKVPYYATIANVLEAKDLMKEKGGRAGELKLKRARDLRAKFASWGEFKLDEEGREIMNAWCANRYDPKKKKFSYKQDDIPDDCLNSDVAEPARIKVKGELKDKLLEADMSYVSASWGWSGGPKRYDLDLGDCIAYHGATRYSWIPEPAGSGSRDFVEITYVAADALKIPSTIWDFIKQKGDAGVSFAASLWMDDIADGMPLEHELHPQLWPSVGSGDSEL